MNASALDQALAPIVKPLRIVTAAMALGAALFLGVTIVLRMRGAAIVPPPADLPVLSYAALALAGAGVAVRAVLPGAIAARVRRGIATGRWKPPAAAIAGTDSVRFEEIGDAGKLLPALVVQTIAAAAVLEGSTLLVIVAYLIEGQTWAAVLAGTMVLVLTFQVPTGFKARCWIENQLRQLEQERWHAA